MTFSSIKYYVSSKAVQQLAVLVSSGVLVW